MTKSLSERIAQRVKTKTPSQFGKNRAAFLAVRAEVKQALEDGWSVKTVWETLREEGKIGFSYHAFIRYVNQLIRQVPPSGAAESVPKEGQGAQAPAAVKQKPSSPPDVGGFKFESIPNKEDLF